MSWQAEVAEIQRRRERALQLGGPQKVAKQHALGKLTARERLALLLDPGSFIEYGQLATQQSQRAEMQGRYTAADGVITGIGAIGGRPVAVGAEDFTTMGGSVGRTGGAKRVRILDLSTQERIPMIWLLDGAGARAEESVRGGWPGGHHFSLMARQSGIVPQVAAVMGPSAGDPALMAPLTDIIFMVKGTSMMAAGGPPVVEAATGEKVSKEELGGSSVHCYVSGVAHNECADDADCIAQVKRYLGYMPTNCWQEPPYLDTGDSPERREEALLSIVPRNRRRPYDMRQLIRLLVDRGDLFEIAPTYGRALITCLARLDGQVVGIQATNPLHLGGAMDSAAADKATRFIELCDAFHIPMVFLADVPGFLVGKAAEREGILRRGLRVGYVLAFASMPRVSVVLRKGYGQGSVAMCGHNMGQILQLTWPSGEFGALPLEGGVNAAYRTKVEDKGELKDIQAQFDQYGSPFGCAETFNFDDLIDPRDTRPLIIKAFRATRERNKLQLGPRTKHGIMP